ncbi:hypothetical protein BIW11_09047 [Tropilaelaps mercedesae]|uniref:Uncharacterized protein n=1 Tax=Tropilaelaps mercedesae TaxID=418985 RepID=A0A1V9XLU7_9ACAR|nr:hypothetical protein BIW11_09047 [Tropilaelaps mercedesae]
MSETDEGSTGFELLDEEPPVDPGNVTPTPKTQSFAMRSAGPPRGSPVAKANPLVAEASAMQMSFPPAQNAPSVPSSVVVLGMRQQAADAAPKKSSASSGQLDACPECIDTPWPGPIFPLHFICVFFLDLLFDSDTFLLAISSQHGASFPDRVYYNGEDSFPGWCDVSLTP